MFKIFTAVKVEIISQSSKIRNTQNGVKTKQRKKKQERRLPFPICIIKRAKSTSEHPKKRF
jgi:hypothetical protein